MKRVPLDRESDSRVLRKYRLVVSHLSASAQVIPIEKFSYCRLALPIILIGAIAVSLRRTNPGTHITLLMSTLNL